ncbi:hypothetical protein J437_LFUL016762 [Ladona fulva]|uniref:Cytochrome P450 n=1 Tax=Ladona fulva TaxID=123851 RepID=A0A8K0NUN1_LADFU|nr:hypothetical protein J437_LFUL016762 [Ladona fulva]
MSILGIIFVAISTLLACAAAFVWWRFSYWRRRGIPYLPPCFPYGNTKDAILGIRPFPIAMDDIYQRVQALPYAGIFKSLQPALLVMDLDLIRDIMVRNALTHFVDRVPQPDTKRDVIFGKTVFAANGAHWRIVRSNPRVDMKLIFAQLTTDFIANSAFGIETNSLNDPGNEFLKNGMKIVEKTTKRYFNTVMVFQYPSLVKLTRSVFLPEGVQNFFRHLVWGVVNDREKKGYTRGDFLDLLIQLKNKGKIQMDEEERGKGVAVDGPRLCILLRRLRDFVHGDEFRFAGTCGESGERLIEEIDDTFEEDGEISYETLHGMKYLDMVVNVDRVCTKEYHNPKFNLTIPKGTEVLIPVYSIQRDPRYYPNPDKFDPERFGDKTKLTNYTFMPNETGYNASENGACECTDQVPLPLAEGTGGNEVTAIGKEVLLGIAGGQPQTNHQAKSSRTF